MYSGGKVFADHVTGLIDIYNQLSLDTNDTIRNKELYDTKSRYFGVTIQSYRGYNRIYKIKPFLDDVKYSKE